MCVHKTPRSEPRRFRASTAAASSGDGSQRVAVAAQGASVVRRAMTVQGGGAQGTAATLRKALRSRRRALPQAEQLRHSEAICRRLMSSALALRGWVAAFAAFDGEPDVMGFVARHPRCALPVVESATRMTFRAYRCGEPLQMNRFGIAEPARGASVAPLRLSAALLPLVAFDDAGQRLGMGAGYYDRRFASRHTVLVGIAHELQRVPRLPHNDWDVPLDAVVTEAGWHCFTARGRNLALC